MEEELLSLYEQESDKQAVSLFLNWFRQLAVYGKVAPADYAALDHVYRTKEEVRTMLVATLERERRSIYEEGREEGLVAGRVEEAQQTLLRLLQWRFALSAQEQAEMAQAITAISDLAHLNELLDALLQAATADRFRVVLVKVDR